jgi:hypothetical protein
MGVYAVEENRTYGAENRVCVEGAVDAQFPGVVPGEWGQCEEWGYKWKERFLRRIEEMGEESRRPQSSP